ncbi:MAG TPA: ATP-dependent 6-phosphofructokinase [Bacillota bacterium]|nr:ATP-dependent 6-phosphofructokinase [Bacillota bacterium]
MIKKIAFMTGGGDCAGINAFIAAAVRQGSFGHQAEFVGIRKAYEGAVSDNIEEHLLPLHVDEIVGLENKPSTILESSRFNPFSADNVAKGYPQKLLANLSKIGVDAILSTGGNDTVKSGMNLSKMGFPIICAPKSIDNDVSGTDTMLGYKSAISFGATAVKSTVETARTHRRISLVEIMGREAGWLTLEIGIAAGVDLIVIPEYPLDLAKFCASVKEIYERKHYVNIVLAEGAKFRRDDPILLKAENESPVVKALIEEDLGSDSHGNPKLGGVGQILRRVIRHQLGLKKIEDVRATDLGFTLRGLEPVADDVVLGTRFGVRAVEDLFRGESGFMLGIQGGCIKKVPFEEALKQKTVDWPTEELKSLGVVL